MSHEDEARTLQMSLENAQLSANEFALRRIEEFGADLARKLAALGAYEAQASIIIEDGISVFMDYADEQPSANLEFMGKVYGLEDMVFKFHYFGTWKMDTRPSIDFNSDMIGIIGLLEEGE